jgi:hypothetical protein
VGTGRRALQPPLSLFLLRVIDNLNFDKEMYYILYNYYIVKIWDSKNLLWTTRLVYNIADKNLHFQFAEKNLYNQSIYKLLIIYHVHIFTGIISVTET